MQETINGIITASGTIALALATVYGGMIEYRRRLTIKRKSYLTKQVSKFNDDLTKSFRKLKTIHDKRFIHKKEYEGYNFTQEMMLFAFEINALLSVTIFTSEALEYKIKDDTEVVVKSKIHRGFRIDARKFRYKDKNDSLKNAINNLAKSIDDMYDESIRSNGDVRFQKIFNFYLDIKQKIGVVESAIR